MLEDYNIKIYLKSMKEISKFVTLMEKEKTIYITQEDSNNKRISSKSLIGLCTFNLSKPLILLINTEKTYERITKKLNRGGIKICQN